MHYYMLLFCSIDELISNVHNKKLLLFYYKNVEAYEK